MRHTRTRWLVMAPVATAAMALALGACGGSSATPAPTAAPVLTGAANGQVIFQQSCASCHGDGGVGSKFTMDEQTIEVPAVTYTELSTVYGDKYDILIPDSITKGVDEEGAALNRMMPRWTIFSPAQLADIVAYLKTLK